MGFLRFKNDLKVFAVVFFCFLAVDLLAQEKQATDVTTPLHLLQPDYPVPYEVPKVDEVKAVLDRVFNYLNEVTPAKVVDRNTNQEITEMNKITRDAVLQQGDFRLTSYEWGVTYAGMLLAGEITGDNRYTEYTETRMKLLSDLTAHGYGPVLLAGAEMISLLKNSFPKINDSAVMFYPEEVKTDAPIFKVE